MRSSLGRFRGNVTPRTRRFRGNVAVLNDARRFAHLVETWNDLRSAIAGLRRTVLLGYDHGTGGEGFPMTDSTQHYLHDVLRELLERARDARARAIAAGPSSSSSDAAFEHGRAVAYYEVLSHLVTQLDAFAIERRSVGIEAGLDVDRELL